MSTSRWLAWTPLRREIDQTLDPEPTKLTKLGSDSFVSASHGLFQEIATPTAAMTRGLPADKDNTRGRSSFPHCPRCASYALYRKNNVGTYECLTCELRGIDETAARRLQ